MTTRGQRLALASLVVLTAASRWLLRAVVPDDWDGVGFVLALDQFDLSRFQPHPPGYPVYVALGRAAHALIGDPLAALGAVGALSAAVTTLALFVVGARLFSPRVGLAAAALHLCAPLPLCLGGAALSDVPAAALLALTVATAAWADRPSRLALSGLLAGLTLGARLSYLPLVVAWAAWLILVERGRAARLGAALGGALVGVLAWLVPLLLVVGPRPLLGAVRGQAEGHFAAWGGTLLSRPGLSLRLAVLLRDLCLDGVAGSAAGLWVLLVLVVVAHRGRPAASCAWRIAGPWLLVLAPYAAWILVGQNVLDQPRHALPLSLAALVALAALLGGRPLLVGAACAVMAATALPRALVHARVAPPAAQMARALAHGEGPLAGPHPALFGGRSLRTVKYLDVRAPGGSPLPLWEAGVLAEVDVRAARLDVLPRPLLVTSEVEGVDGDPRDARRARSLRPVGRWCREPVIDHLPPCLSLAVYDPVAARAPLRNEVGR